MRYSSRQHLRKAADFQAIRASGKHQACGFFYLNFLNQPDRDPPLRRAGFIASKRVGNAVQRNRCKRRLREVFRNNQDLLPPSCDVVLIARPATINANASEIERQFRSAIQSFKEKIS